MSSNSGVWLSVLARVLQLLTVEPSLPAQSSMRFTAVQLSRTRGSCAGMRCRGFASVPTIIAAAAPGGGGLSTEVTPRRPALSHYFDTFQIVTRLEAAGFAHGQAVATMNAIRALLVNSTEIAKAEMLSKAELENQTYLFRAAMSELRTEIQMMRKNESTQLRLDALQLQRQLEMLDQRMREDLQTMRTEVEMDVEMRRSSTRAESKDIELRIQELDNKFTVRLGDLRTAMERYKWDTTRRLLLALVAVAVVGTYVINRPRTKKLDPPEEDKFVSDDLGLQVRPGNAFVSLG